MEITTLWDFCAVVTDVITKEQGIELGAEERTKLVDDLEKEFRQSYVDAGYPNGESDDEMVLFYMENTKIEIEGEES